jgi:hypothetical protein
LDNPNPLVNIGDLAKPANTLVEKISDAIGGIFKPVQIKRVAHAEAEAEKIRVLAQIEAEKMRALGQIEITDLHRRAMARFVAEEAKKQDNIESITRKALPEVSDQARPEEIEDDWIVHFFDKCRLISDEEIQTLWARVLSGQANSPGTYGKRTIEVLSTLEKSDAVLFSSLCKSCVSASEHFDPKSVGYPFIYDSNHEIYNKEGISYASLVQLESLGLIRYTSTSGYVLTQVKTVQSFFYFNTQIWVRKEPRRKFYMGDVVFTPPGRELARVCHVERIEEFPQYLEDHWKRMGYIIEQGPDKSETNQNLPPDPPPPSDIDDEKPIPI